MNEPEVFTVVAPMAATVVEVSVGEGGTVAAGRPVVVLESMKMEHEVPAPLASMVWQVHVEPGSSVNPGDPLVSLTAADTISDNDGDSERETDPDRIRGDLAEAMERRRMTLDESRPEAVAKRHSRQARTARENIADLVDPGSFTEYGGLAVAAQRDRRSLEDLVANTPADGLVGGLATIGARNFGPTASRCVVMSYDYTVLAGTQGYYGHLKKDRLFELADRLAAPVVLFAEGGGGRPGDTSAPQVSGLDVMAFALFAKLSGKVPLVGIAAGRCFAGNAALLGCCDVVIATENSSIGMAGPAMIEGGGLGRVSPDEVGPSSVQSANGVIDILVPDEAAAVDAARRYLGYFQGRMAGTDGPDQRLLRHVIPEDRRRVYDIRRVVEGLADTDSVTELRAGWGAGMVTALARLGGRPVGVIANNPAHLGGAIDSDAADKAARFMALCDGFDIPLVFLCDTPGFMVGPDAERSAQVRHFARMFVVGTSISVPLVTVILRKGYGLGAQAMAGGSFRVPAATVAWPTGEIGGMGLEGAVRLGFRRELDAQPDEASRRDLEERLVGAAYRNGKALNAATHFEVDDVIDPAETKDRILAVLAASPEPVPFWQRGAKKRPCIDTW